MPMPMPTINMTLKICFFAFSIDLYSNKTIIMLNSANTSEAKRAKQLVGT